MAKLNADPITASDLTEWLTSDSDFAFEQMVLHDITQLKFDAQHGGTYDDPHTGTPREFDIRAIRTLSATYGNKGQLSLRIAAECKNIRANSPVLIQCVPRHNSESYHEVVISSWEGALPDCRSHRLTNNSSLYREGRAYDPDTDVGKNCTRVARTDKGGISVADQGLYTKWSQALSSASDLIREASTNPYSQGNFAVAYSVIIPFLVVPDNTLWQVKYDGKGARVATPELIDWCSYYVGKPYTHSLTLKQSCFTYWISHIEFCTRSGLSRRLQYLTSEEWEHILFDVH